MKRTTIATGSLLATAAVLHGRTLHVDSHFDEPVASAPYEILTDPR